MPLAQPIDLHGEQTDLIPALQLADAAAQVRRDACDCRFECIQPGCLYLLERTFANDKAGLKIIAATD